MCLACHTLLWASISSNFILNLSYLLLAARMISNKHKYKILDLGQYQETLLIMLVIPIFSCKSCFVFLVAICTVVRQYH